MRTAALLQRVAPLAALLLLGACAGGRDADDDLLADAARGDPGFEARGAEIVETGPDGAPRYRVRAAVIAQDPASRNVLLQQVELKLADAAGADWAVEARSGQMPADAQAIDLTGDVHVLGRAAPDDEPLSIRSEHLSYDFDRQVARSDTNVTLTMGARSLEALGLVADLKAGRVQLESKVHGRFNPQ
jgi:lipopolysaccharide export system protein LptC